jgi:hypothetical protein
MSSRAKLGTFAIIAVYAAVMICTNSIYTFIDDETTIVTVAGHPILPTIGLFLAGGNQHEHPPASDILLHLWLLATGYSMFMLRIFANIFFIAGIFFTAKSAQKLGGPLAYWVTLVLGFAWPFAFQYGRITGWYCFSLFLGALATCIYLRLVEGAGRWTWAAFALVSVVYVWTNYFSVAILAILLLDFLCFHRAQARKQIKPLLMASAVIVMSFLPFIKTVLINVQGHGVASAAHGGWKNTLAVVGYPVYSIFGSAAVAPWFLPLSIPVFLAMAALAISIACSPGRKWLSYYVVSMFLLELSGHMDIKRVLFLLPWLFIAIALSMTCGRSWHRTAAWAASGVIVVAGWIGIVSGNHYSTTNLHEPWQKVAQVVAGDARQGATIVSMNPPFFFYLNYQLGLEPIADNAGGTYLGPAFYQAHGYKVVEPDDGQQLAASLYGKVVLVKGSATKGQVRLTDELDKQLSQRCAVLGDYHAAPDPAAALKSQFARNAPVLAYRVNVTWYDCQKSAR